MGLQENNWKSKIMKIFEEERSDNKLNIYAYLLSSKYSW
jgi:hypothetical protein